MEVKVGTEERITRAREILAKLDKGKPLQQKKEEDEILSRRPSVSAHVAQKDNVVEGTFKIYTSYSGPHASFCTTRESFQEGNHGKRHSLPET